MSNQKIPISGWRDDYKGLNLCNGKINFISDDDEDMIEIFYDDGMLIDVGKPMSTNYYCITVVSSDDVVGWKHPIAEIAVIDKRELVQKIQETILKFRHYPVFREILERYRANEISQKEMNNILTNRIDVESILNSNDLLAGDLYYSLLHFSSGEDDFTIPEALYFLECLNGLRKHSFEDKFAVCYNQDYPSSSGKRQK